MSLSKYRIEGAHYGIRIKIFFNICHGWNCSANATYRDCNVNSFNYGGWWLVAGGGASADDHQ